MSIREEEDKLFSEWKKNRKGFVSDGVVSEEDYENSNPKIAVILKEVNDPDGGNWDLRDKLREGIGYKIWCNVARWVYGIKNLGSIPDWGEFQDKVDEAEERKELFKSICVMNLNKSPGGSVASESWKKIAEEDKEYIQNQYAIYKPDITLCGGTSDVFKDVMDHDDQWKQTTRGAWWYEIETGKYVAHLYHPAIRGVVRNPLVFYEMFDTVKELLDKKCPA